MAEDLANAWTGSAGLVHSLDGYFAAATYDEDNGLVVGADVLGLFPVFWWHSGDVLLVGSSPELFKHHPLFRFALDLAGLTGILLMMHSVGGRTLMTGVNRLGAGRALVWRRGTQPREVLHYQLPASMAYFDLPFSAAVELVNDTLRRAVARQVPSDARVGMTLSGGRDSRLIAGIMAALGLAPIAITFGNEGDIEMQCAKAVGRALRLEHRSAEMGQHELVDCADLHVRWLHCCTGFNSMDYWHCREALHSLPPYFVSGYLLDSILGGSHFAWAYSDATRDMSFANFFAQNNRYGIELSKLRSLLRPELFGTLIDDLIGNLRSTYEGYSDLEAQRAWCFDLHHRQRFHVGTPPWLFSFGSWPIMPAADKRMLQVMGGLPVGVAGERRAQDEIIRKYFPALAELPLDRNGYDTTPLSPRVRHILGGALRGRIAPITKMLTRTHSDLERRFYYRLLDFNGPVWKMVRQKAEPHRRKLEAFFNKDVLDALLPRPQVDIRVPNSIIDLSGRRLLVGLCLWAENHL